jgi:oligopeptide/dipeptide ABC transporter ATP-binding protein
MNEIVPVSAQPILELKNLKTYFFLEKSTVRALDGIDLTLPDSSTLGVVGESGCGKSVMAMTIMRLIQSPPGKIVEGEILLNLKKTHNLKSTARALGPESQARLATSASDPAAARSSTPAIDIAKLDPRGSMMRQIRGGEIAMIFQEPMTSLNPLYRIGDQIAEAVKVHQKVGNKEAKERALEMLTKVQISAPKQRINEYPHQLSGGMRQRVMIALALSCNPSILIADEPTTALDVTVQAQILDLMNQLQQDFGASIIIISHNLGVVSQMARQVAVMYLGKIIELGETSELFHNPLHPYTVGLLNSVPVLGRKGKKILVPIKGMVPTPTAEIIGCPFAPRCPRVMAICRERTPLLRQVTPGHETACWLYSES